MATKRRARKQEDKDRRRQSILDAAERIFARVGHEPFTMSMVATETGVAKGTLYLYFQTKEEVLVALLQGELQTWFDALMLAIPPTGRGDPAALAATMVRLTGGRETMLRLLGLLGSVLEENATVEAVRVFKTFLRDQLARVGTRLEEHLGFLRPGDGARVVVLLDALVVGLGSMARPSPVVARVLAEPGLQCLTVDFEKELQASFTALLLGLRAQGVAGRD